MEWVIYNKGLNEYTLLNENCLPRLSSLYENPSEDRDLVDEFNELEEGWELVGRLESTTDLGEVYDDASITAWLQHQSVDATLPPETEGTYNRPADASPPPDSDVPGTQIGLLLEAIKQYAGQATSRSPTRAESPYYTKEEAAQYLRTTVDGIYGRVERGDLKTCPGVREYFFTRQMLDESMMVRERKPSPKRRRKK